MTTTATVKAASPFWKSMIPQYFRNRAAGFHRQHERKNCVVIGKMDVVEVGAEFDGVVLELSKGGCSFRPATLYMLERSGLEVTVKTEFFTAHGVIRATRSNSYGIQFFDELDEVLIEDILAEHGGMIADSFLARPV